MFILQSEEIISEGLSKEEIENKIKQLNNELQEAVNVNII